MRRVAEPVLAMLDDEEEEDCIMNESTTTTIHQHSTTPLCSPVKGTYTPSSGPTTPVKPSGSSSTMERFVPSPGNNTPTSPINYNNLYGFSNSDISSQNLLFASQNPYNMGFHFQHMCQQFTRMSETLDRELELLLKQTNQQDS